MKKTLCVITSTRAEYGLLKYLLRDIQGDNDLRLQIIATGTHLSPGHGFTVNEILEDGFQIDAKVEMLVSSDSGVGVTKSMGLGLIGFADALEALAPDALIIVGDRYEMLVGAAAALIAKIPIVHIHGGEITEGALDDCIRHSITKMAHLHFVSTDDYRRRVIQLGEHPNTVFCVGGLGISGVMREPILSRDELESELGFSLAKKNLLITFHPETISNITPENQINELLQALEKFPNTNLVFTGSNADSGGQEIMKSIKNFASLRSNAHIFQSLGTRKYYSCLAHFDGVIGNSSSGLLEAPSFGIGTVNIGDRQKGRQMATSVINSSINSQLIEEAIDCLFSDEFIRSLEGTINPYDQGDPSSQIIKFIKHQDFASIFNKRFYDLWDDGASYEHV